MNRKVLSTQTSCIRSFAEWAAGIDDCIGLTLGEPDFDTPKEIREAAKHALDCSFTHYPPGAGVFSLRDKLSKFEYTNKGLEYTPQEIIITNGATEAVASVLKAILNPGDEVIIFTPAFGLYRALTELYGGRCVAIDTADHDFDISGDKLRAAISDKTKCIVLNYPNNPTGATMSRSTADMLYEIVKDKNIFILCDEVYDTLVYDENHVSFATYAELREKLIIVQSFSKPYAMTGWRIGYIMADLPIVNEIFKCHQYTVSGVSHFSQIACLKALESDVDYMRDSYKERSEFVYKRLVEMGFEVMKPRGTFYIFPSTRKFSNSSMEFCHDLALKEKVVIIPAECFENQGYARISCCYNQRILDEAMNRIERFVRG
ncbi:MAG: pyridoxal phosphate-dependent aminotransferase [Aminipila sp.]